MWRAGCLLALLLGALGARSVSSPPGRSDWITFGYDIQRTGWNRAERALSPGTVGQMRRVWKTVLPNAAHVLAGLSAPLVATTTARELVIIAGSDDHLHGKCNSRCRDCDEIAHHLRRPATCDQ